MCALAEIAARAGLNRISQIHRRTLQEQRAARGTRPAPAGQPKTILFVGNSLLLEGIDFPQLAERSSSRFRSSRFIMEQTYYLDWVFGLRHLFREGAHPDYLVLSLSPGELRANRIRGDFSARFLLDFRDILPVSRAVNSDLTTTSSLYFAHFSTFYAARAELRTVLIGKVLGITSVPLLWHTFAPVAGANRVENMTSIYAARLQVLSRLCAAKGVQFILLVPPTLEYGDSEVEAAGKIAHVVVLRPVPNYSLGPEYYRDGFHLNARGASIFTAKTVEAMALVP